MNYLHFNVPYTNNKEYEDFFDATYHKEVGHCEFQVRDQWFFFDETWGNFYGPYETEQQAIDNAKNYASSL